LFTVHLTTPSVAQATVVRCNAISRSFVRECWERPRQISVTIASLRAELCSRLGYSKSTRKHSLANIQFTTRQSTAFAVTETLRMYKQMLMSRFLPMYTANGTNCICVYCLLQVDAMLITLAVNWAVTEIMISNINYKCLVIYAEQSNTYYVINLNRRQF
jgi:hypothetical protein